MGDKMRGERHYKKMQEKGRERRRQHKRKSANRRAISWKAGINAKIQANAVGDVIDAVNAAAESSDE